MMFITSGGKNLLSLSVALIMLVIELMWLGNYLGTSLNIVLVLRLSVIVIVRY